MILLQIMKREFFQALHDPRRFLLLFGASIAYLFLFKMLYSTNIVNKIPLVIYDAENTKLSREIVTGFYDSENFKIVAQVDSEEKMLSCLKEKRAFVALEIPADFSKKISSEGTASVLYEINGANIIMTNVTSSSAQDILNTVSEKFAKHRAALNLGINEETTAKKISPVTTTLRVLGNPLQGYLLFFPIGLAMAALQQGLLFTVGASILWENHEEHKFKFWQLLLGKTLFYWIGATLAFVITIFALEKFLEIPPRVSLLKLFILGGSYSLAVVAFGEFFASFFKQEVNFVRASLMYPVPAFIFSGYTFPTESMGEIWQVISCAFPFTWLANALRELLLIGSTAHLEQNILIMFAMGIIFLILTLRKKLTVANFG